MPDRPTDCVPASSITVTSSIPATVGASFTGVTVTWKLTRTLSTPPFAVPPSSRTVTVTVATPLASPAGVNVSVPVADGLV